MQKAKDAWDRAGKAIDKTEINLAKIEQAQQDIENTALVTFNWKMGDGRNDFYIGTKANASKYHWFGATATHGHTLTTTFTGGVLKLHIKTSSSTNSPANTELADLSAAVKDLSGDSSTGKLSWSTYGGGSGNFNIADTQFYKDGVEAAYENGWKDAIATLSLSGSGNTATASVGNETYGSASLSTTATVGRDMTGSYDFGAAGRTWYYGITATAPGVWSASASKKIGYRYLYSGATGKITGWSVAK